MTHIQLVVDGNTMWSGDLGQWKDTPPTAIQHMIQSGRKAQPYMQAALGALLEAALKEQDTAIEATTTPTGWVLRVTHMAVVAR